MAIEQQREMTQARNTSRSQRTLATQGKQPMAKRRAPSKKNVTLVKPTASQPAIVTTERQPTPVSITHLSVPRAEEIEAVARDLEHASPHTILTWALKTYGERITLACSFGGPSGMALLDMVMALDARVPVFYLDTGLLFPETYTLVDEAAKRYGITPVAIRPGLTVAQQAQRYGEALWSRDPDQCCELRKVVPQREALSGYDAWITGLRRDQAQTRRATPAVAWDAKFGLAKICPLVNWTEEDVWAYISANNVPYNALHDQNYPSIGCTHCTRPVAPGEDLRAGRWSSFTKTECGLHTRPA